MSKEKTKALHQAVQPYAKSDTSKSVAQLLNTIIPYFAMWVATYFAYEVSIWLMIPFAAITAGFTVRLFIIFHDCTHGSFFKSKKANDFVGTVTGILTLFPYEMWKREHSIHHATSSNLDKRGVGDIWVMTVEEYEEANKGLRLAYRLYRNPLVMFGLGPIYLILISNRFNRKGVRSKERINTYITNVSLIVLYTALSVWIGWQTFLIIQGTIMFIAGMLGIWLFFIQHTFEDSYFEEQSEWDYVKAAVEGSSYYELPKVLQWITGNIGFHHVHHLAPRVPNYRLEEAHNEVKPLQYATKITLKTSLQSLRYKLYDRETYSFITFKEARQKMKRARTVNFGAKRRVTE